MGKKMTLPVSVGIAATWFGMHCGSGFATGKQYTIYYNAYGWLAMITPLITWGILAASMYFVFEYGRLLQINSYKEYAENLFIKKSGWLFVLLFDIWSVCAQILGEMGIMAGSGALFQQSYGWNYWIGVVLAGAIVAAVVFFGAKALMKFSTILTGGLIVCIVILGFAGLAQNWTNFVQVLSTRAMPEGVTFWDAVKASFTYAGVQIGSLFALSGLVKEMKSSKESKQAAFGGAFLNLILLMILGLVMIANYPDINKETLPVFTALAGLNSSLLTFMYQIMLFLALITTGAGCAFAITNRFKVYFEKYGLGEKVSVAIILTVLLLIGAFGSKFGLAAVFKTGYGYLAKLAWPLGIIPALTLVPYRISQIKKGKAAGAQISQAAVADAKSE
jgi:uncharacterized membrane protein YkvI